MQGFINQLLITINDVWGRVVPGGLLLVDIYLLYLWWCPESTQAFFGSFVITFLQANSTLFVVVLLLVAFLAGHVPLWVIYKLLFQHIGYPSVTKTIKDIDPTGKMESFYQDYFQMDIIFPLVILAIACALFRNWVWAGVALLLGLLFFRLARRTQARECEDSLRLFYHHSLSDVNVKPNSTGGRVQ
ncbi:MAG: hypothetical protein P1R58_08720 [bacterium]|nr:hypothetical protein [bacterium]